MSNLKRYDIDVGNACGDEYTCKIEMSAVPDGDWVKFEDIKHLLPTGAQQPQGAIPPDTAPHAADVVCN